MDKDDQEKQLSPPLEGYDANHAKSSNDADAETGVVSIETATVSKHVSCLKTRENNLEERAWAHYKALEPRLRNVSRMLADS